MNRETWLNKAIIQFKPIFKAVDAELPDNIRVTCGFPSKSAGRSSKQRIGECWSDKASADQTVEVIISMVIDAPISVLDILCHELVHASVGTGCGHKGEFRRLARALGLEGKLTATHAGTELLAKLEIIAAKLGDYPHAKIDFSNRKKQTTRMLKIKCLEPECGMVFRTSSKWIERNGGNVFQCPICGSAAEGND
jgi:predicted RNA-binding Zn-ribbon protein involved in translation (DUF1610 family)